MHHCTRTALVPAVKTSYIQMLLCSELTLLIKLAPCARKWEYKEYAFNLFLVPLSSLKWVKSFNSAARRILTWLCLLKQAACKQFCSLYDCVTPGREVLDFLQCCVIMVLCDLVREVVNHIKCGHTLTVHRVGFIAYFAWGIQILKTIPECTLYRCFISS